MSLEWTSDHWITDWEVSKRYPVYTRANAGEVLPTRPAR